MKLEEIGFYTLSDTRAKQASGTSSLQRCELILTGRCNFKCPYCRSVGGADIDFDAAAATIIDWSKQGLVNIRFSGGEPTLYRDLNELVILSRVCCIKRIAISTNGSAPLKKYQDLISLGVNDLSISLDACCSEDGDKMAGGVKGSWDRVVSNIRELSKLTYVTVGVVVTPDNIKGAEDTIKFAHDLGVADIRIIPAAQSPEILKQLSIPAYILESHPILRYRVDNLRNGVPFRGIGEKDSHRCRLVLDDMAVMGNHHYPCIIYMREGGVPVGAVNSVMREDRVKWSKDHCTYEDPICKANCLDVCRDYNSR